MTSPVDICNIALDNIGARFSITSLTPPLPPPNAAVCARQYSLRINALARAAHWNCLRAQTPLTILKAAIGTPENPSGADFPIPPVPYQYEYQYPPDCLAARYILPNPPNMTNTSGQPILGGGAQAVPYWNPPVGYKFAVATDFDTNGNRIKVILTDLEFAQLVYTAQIDDPDIWDPHFQTAASASLGAWLVNPLARNAEVLKEQIEIAKSIIIGARLSDGNEGVTSQDHDPDWMRARGSGGYGFLYGPATWYGWDSMGFPGGVLV